MKLFQFWKWVEWILPSDKSQLEAYGLFDNLGSAKIGSACIGYTMYLRDVSPLNPLLASHININIALSTLPTGASALTLQSHHGGRLQLSGRVFDISPKTRLRLSYRPTHSPNITLCSRFSRNNSCLCRQLVAFVLCRSQEYHVWISRHNVHCNTRGCGRFDIGLGALFICTILLHFCTIRKFSIYKSF